MASTEPPPTALGDWAPPLAPAALDAVVTVPGSKSLTNRYLVLAALAETESVIRGWLRSRDTELMVGALRSLGATITESDDELHVAPIDFTASAGAGPVTIDCGLAGTVMRFVPPIAAATGREVVIDGDEQARVRPMDVTIDSLTRLGATVTSANDALPLTIRAGSSLRGGHLEIAAGSSSQFVSGLLLAAPAMPLGLELSNRGDAVPSRAHIDMTLEVLADAGVDVTEPETEHWIVEPGLPRGLDVVVEPDLSNAAAFLAAAVATGGTVTVPGWPVHTTQAGDDFRRIAEAFGAEAALDRHGLRVRGPERLSPVDLDLSAVGELTPVVAALAALAPGTSHLRGIGHLRGHETDRLAALAAELGGLGVPVEEHADALTITGAPLGSGTWHTYHDHRMVMAGAVLALRGEGIVIENVGTVAKTLPEFASLWEAMLTAED
ncbi:3-phosphoshikimate 1-carboxyvinyltransferase [Brevibacterium casei]|uniref:3-phosphoshikimate 1-carboxyvinyltransferase n=1 Tax=Brevibacterium casei TaxID=33889 RepID=UPI00246894CB|nr:3-phosphoshikimate 1-carboxyvinyltransferase [Brevibacterium casei]MDH5149374.1 3-phosphoshikimate 1-carboxyvinyltransferase [Brevibacterium casei]